MPGSVALITQNGASCAGVGVNVAPSLLPPRIIGAHEAIPSVARG